MKRIILIFVFTLTNIIFSQQDSVKDRHQFKMLKLIETTPVESQGYSGTCWAFASTSFVETELLRLGFDKVNLSEMFTVRHKLLPMAKKYVQLHGKGTFGDGGQAHDLINVIKKYGFVPEENYSGKVVDKEKHNHGEMTTVLKGMLDAVIKKKGGKLTDKWDDAVESVLNIYLGIPPKNFKFKEKEFTPKSFCESTGFNPDDYVELTSYTHHPFYEEFILELPDNWSNGKYYNVPIEDIIKIIDNSLNNGYSVAWDGDSGRDNFLRKECYAVIPEDKENEKKDDKDNTPEKEKNITQEMRQEAFDNFDVTDDHLMHIVGLAENQEGTKFYYTKNSWGTKDRKYDGYWYMSESYIKLKTVAIMVHKDAIPQTIKDKLGI
ncbi:MAG: aminopeptidase [Ignavibacteriae bacterium]|nr:MAG: aminopeptidase [Ignavibacteriota bacterium]